MEWYPKMRKNNLSRNQALISIALTLFTAAADADTLTGRVVEIADGDTLTLLVGRQHYTIKIASIDAPERSQAWGDRSKTNLSRLTFNQTAVAECFKLDRWGHKVCRVTVNSVDIGLEQINDGLAWWYRKDANEQTAASQSAYGRAELMAKLKRLGLWDDTKPVPPWSFRGGR
jgi:endonuclease YncB( thermonuclease family)